MSLKIALCGDIMLGRSFNQIFKDNPNQIKEVWGNTMSIFRDSDIVIGNLETTITNSDDPWSNKAFNYKMNPKYSQTLSYPGFTYLSLANNHILDYKSRGIRDTQANLRQLGINYGGAGYEIEAMTPTIFSVSGNHRIKNIIIFSASDHYDYWTATPNRPGIFYINHRDPESINKAVLLFKNYKRSYPNSFVILSYHWGPNWESEIPEWKRNLAQLLFENGIDLIHGHSAHHIESAEIISGKAIFYSLGDLIDDYAIDPGYRNDIGMIATLNLNLTTGKIEPESIKMILTQNTHHNGKFQVNILPDQ